MKTVLIYTTIHGTTEKVAHYIAEHLADVTILKLSNSSDISISSFDRVILGGSIHIGSVQSSLKKFCTKHRHQLLSKPIALFVCGMEEEPAKQEEELRLAFPEEISQHALAKAFVGGEFLFEKMNFIQRMMIKKIAHTDVSRSEIKYDVLNSFISEIESN
jgi:menaquinone-dependent protoporphyrinogen oxidase